MNDPILIAEWLPDGVFERLQAEFPHAKLIDARSAEIRDARLKDAVAVYGLPPIEQIQSAPKLRWIQLISAGVPWDLCPVARGRGITVTNLSGLYGTTIAEHALAMMLQLSRNLHIAFAQQQRRIWDRTLRETMRDLHGATLGIVGAGDIGQSIARLCRALGMRVVGCRRTPQPTPYVDQVYPIGDLQAMLAECDVLAVAAPLTAQSENMLGTAEFAALKRGAIYINVSRGGIAQEQALLAALQSGHVAAAGLDVFAVEPLAPDHPFWSMPQVLVSPHYSGETINLSARPAERFARNLSRWLKHEPLEGLVDLEAGY
ncbi:MAG: D-2-hydroxyacid dehydrogenase [Planctomycetes bacterium]|nr:D-2-hydroxyacid dehydrogenase [Planctomycetota bacterium]